MALHHDESIHAWMSWKFFTGQGGGFRCANGQNFNTYCYDPVYHGPSLYVFTLISYFLFGDGDAQARYPQALSGVLLVASCWWLRPYFGKRGALIAGVLIALSPTILYFTRFARHDGLIILFTFWMVIGFFRYLDSGKPGFLYLLAIGTALAVATHELYYILFFIFGSFVGIRLINETRFARYISTFLMAVVVAAILVELSIIFRLWSGRISDTLGADGIALLFFTVALTGLFISRLWDTRPFLINRLQMLWFEQRDVLWKALVLFFVIYSLLYSTFFAYPRGLLGPYDGLAYWLGSQQDYKRGDQPWYYYLMQLSIYEPLAFFGSFGAMIYLFSRHGRSFGAMFNKSAPHQPKTPPTEALNETEHLAEAEGESPDTYVAQDTQILSPENQSKPVTNHKVWYDSFLLTIQPIGPFLFPLFLAFWFVSSLVAFSWAGEKMPWLTIHITLPAVLLISWAIDRMIEALRSRHTAGQRAWLIAPITTLLLITIAVTFWRLNPAGEGQLAQASIIQGLIPLAIVGVLIYALLSIGQRVGLVVTLAVCGLTLAGLLSAYGIRSAWLVAYRQPDVPREFLIFVQSSPDVPLIARAIRELAINQTRNNRTEADPIGGLSMPVIMDIGDDKTGEGSLSWPFQWYLRDFQRLQGRNAEFFRTASPESFQVDGADGQKQNAPVVMLYTPHLAENTRQALEANYVKRFDAKLNWWFPEGNKCRPQEPGYKRFYYSASPASLILKECGESVNPDEFGNIVSPFWWVADSNNWATWGRYLLFRELPAPLRLDGREIQIWFRRDLVPNTSEPAGDPTTNAVVRLVPQQVIEGRGAGQFAEPRGLAVDTQGQMYVSDLAGHRVQVLSRQGQLLRTIGQRGAGDGDFNEPRGLAIDREGNLYVADTWNARIAKFSPDGQFIKAWGSGDQDFGEGRRATINNTDADNQSRPLGFFGPRSIAIDQQGNVFIADTGNKRIVVTDREGNYLYQWGRAGSAPGEFNEPTGIAVDPQGNVYVADVWNGRVQVFAREEAGQINPLPITTWNVSGWQANSYDDPMIAADAEQVIVAVPARNQVIAFNKRGDLLLRWGGRGTDTAALVGATGIAIDANQRIFIADRGNARISEFQLPRFAPAPVEVAPTAQ
jgi:uncharacterized protein (TIGR03663 family)